MTKKDTKRRRTTNGGGRNHAGEALRAIVEGTASASGDEFFRALVRHLASALGVRYSFVACVTDAQKDPARTLAVWADDDFGENFEYDLAGTPCENVVGQRTCFYPSDVQRHFPDDELLTQVGAESYLGTPMFGPSGEALGLLVVMDDKPMESMPDNEQILSIFAARAGAEIERKRADDALRESEQRLRSTLDAMLEACMIVSPDWRYLYVNDALTAQGRNSREALLGRTMMEMYPGIEDTEMFHHMQQCMEEGTAHRMENEFVFPDGDVGWFELSIQRVPEGVLVLSVDITKRKRLEEDLQRARDVLEAKVEQQIVRRNPYGLSFREFTVLHLVAGGRADKEIARELGISPLTAQKHVANILAKMNAPSRTEASVRAIREGLIS